MSNLPIEPQSSPLQLPPQRWCRLSPLSREGGCCPTDSAQSKRWRKLLSEEQF